MKALRVITMAMALLFIIGPTAFAKVEPGLALRQAVDINNATAQSLIDVPYIGPKRAAQIIARRQEKPFASVDELVEIRGIGPEALEKIRPHVVVKKKGPTNPK